MSDIGNQRAINREAHKRIRFDLGYRQRSDVVEDVNEISANVVPDWSYLKDGRYGIMVACAGKVPSGSNPYGLAGGQELSLAACEAWFDEQFSRGEAWYDSNGYARMVFHRFQGGITPSPETGDMRGNMGIMQPAGADMPAGASGFSGRVQAFLERAQQYYEYTNGTGTIGFYTSGQVPPSADYYEDDQSDPLWVVYDDENLAHRAMFFGNIVQHTIEAMVPYGLYPHELWFDWLSPSTSRTDGVKLVRRLREKYNIHSGGEAIPSDRIGDVWVIDYPALQRAPYMALHQFYLARDPDMAWKVPEVAELGYLMSHHGGTDPVQADMISRAELGYVMWSFHVDFDAMLQAVHNSTGGFAPGSSSAVAVGSTDVISDQETWSNTTSGGFGVSSGFSNGYSNGFGA